jgi:hypothetical protein
MKTIAFTTLFVFVCLSSYAEPYQVQKEVRVEPSRSCSLEEFSSRESGQKYAAQNGGELFRDQDTGEYRVVKCNFDIADRVLIVSSLEADSNETYQSTAMLSGR